jgi:hypothetical protein
MEKYPLTEKISVPHRIKFVITSFLLAIVFASIFAFLSYVIFRNINLFPIMIIFVFYLIFAIRQFGKHERYKILYKEDGQFVYGNTYFKLNSIKSLKRIVARRAYSIYRIELITEYYNEDTQKGKIIKFEVLDYKSKQMKKTQFEALVYDEYKSLALVNR